MVATLSVCMIVRDEPLLEECILSFREHVAELVIVSNDPDEDSKTSLIAKKYANKFCQFLDCNDQQGRIADFSMLRNKSLELASYPTILWIDGDDILFGAEKLEDLLKEAKNLEKDGKSVLLHFPYEYSYSGEKVSCRQFRERLSTNKNDVKFINPVHECLVPHRDVLVFSREEIIWKHQRQISGKIIENGRNLRILEQWFSQNDPKKDPRQLYYLGLELANNGRADEAIKRLEEYIELSFWDEEKQQAAIKIVDICQDLGRYSLGMKWALKAIEIKPHWFESYFAACRMSYFLGEGSNEEREGWSRRCISFGKTALDCGKTETSVFINPLQRESEIYQYLNVAFNRIGDISSALENVELGLKNDPDNPFFINNKRIYQDLLAKRDVCSGINKLIELGSLSFSAADKIVALLQGKREISPLPAGKLDIVFFAGNGMEVWNPDTIEEKGIGGSELMMFEMARRLAKSGHRASVFSSCGRAKEYEGVFYDNTENFHHLSCDILIVSRFAPALNAPGVSARVKLLWVHDLIIQGFSQETVSKADAILALSEFHKNHLMQNQGVAADRIRVTRNGIDPSIFQVLPRDRFKLINASSPDRSWALLLDIYPELKRKFTQLSLDLYYGFDGWKAGGDPGQLAIIKRLEDKIKELQPFGVTYYGRVNQRRLADAFSGASVYPHPTWFCETSGISFMNAQMAGMKVVSSAIGALPETLSNRGFFISRDWKSPEYRQEFIEKVSLAIETSEEERKEMQEFAKKAFSLSTLIKDWEEMFQQMIDNQCN
jgi:glycosyltransferase involved in cell wall biosynthesis